MGFIRLRALVTVAAVAAAAASAGAPGGQDPAEQVADLPAPVAANAAAGEQAAASSTAAPVSAGNALSVVGPVASPMELKCVAIGYQQEQLAEVVCDGVVLVASHSAAVNPKSVPAAGLQHVTAGNVCHQDLLSPGSPKWWLYCFYAFCCVMGAAMAAGLTLGLTSIDEFGLKVLCNRFPEEVSPSSAPQLRMEEQKRLLKDQMCARRILPVISGRFFAVRLGMPKALNPTNKHYLLVTLLLANAAANEALPIFLGQMVPEWLAVVLSVTVVLVFGEIMPSAIFTGPNQLPYAAAMSPMVRLIKMLLLPVVWPISLLLDFCLGHEQEDHCRGEVKALIRTLKSDCLELEEASLLHGVLELHYKKAPNISVPLEKACMLPHDAALTDELVTQVLSWGHPRILVYRRDERDPARRDDIMGVLYVQDLLRIGRRDGSQISSLEQALVCPVVLSPEDDLLSTLRKFQKGNCGLGVISHAPDAASAALASGGSMPEEARPYMFCSRRDVVQEILKGESLGKSDPADFQKLPTNSTVFAKFHGTKSIRSNVEVRNLVLGVAPTESDGAELDMA